MKIHTYFFILVAALLWTMPSYAQNTGKAIPQTVEELKAMSKPESKLGYEKVKPIRVPAVRHRVMVEEKTIRVSPGKSKTVPLARDAASVVVANPAHATVFLDSPRMLVIMPRTPGATELLVLDAQGREILKKGVLVDGAGDDHVRIRRICDPEQRECQAQTIYYCPDNNCAEVVSPEADTSGNYPVVPANVSPRPSFNDFEEEVVEPTRDDR